MRYDEEESQAAEPDDPDLDLGPKTHGRQGVVVLSIFTLTFMICGAILLIRLPSSNPAPADANNEQLVLDKADRLQGEGMAALREWNKARRDGDRVLEKQKHAEARSKLEASLETLERLLDRYRDSEGYLLPEYQGYEEQLSGISVCLGDLLKGSRLDSSPGR